MMREITKAIPSSAIKIITQQIIKRFPKTFGDLDEDGVTIGDGTYSLYNKLYDRHHYLNRPYKRGIKRSMESGTLYQGHTTSLLVNISENDDNLNEKLDKSFPEERQLPIGNSSLEMIRQKCPILLTKIGAIFYFNKVTGSDMSQLEGAVEEKCQKFLKLKGTQIIDEGKSKLLVILEIVSKYFKENMSSIYIESNIIPDTKALGSHPLIVKVGNRDDFKNIYLLYYEKCCVDEKGCQSFDDAFRIAFAFYFNFDLKYPSDISLTLEFVQRYFFKIHPDTGPKANKASFSKIINLINKLTKL
ncbi:hypothetical protein JTB14_025585 [Gonioctena quinquepunctata]|nr:hypothetical protein JTB14_025585 [Gonioctena quinquepunctata]